VKEVAWWSVYEIGQRVCDKFDNFAEGESDTRMPNAFIAGDACHTHSPKAGQGMNVSIHDSFNLGWKLASVIRGHSSPKILHTYSAERHEVAKELIAFDRELATMFSVPVESSLDVKTRKTDPTELQQYMVRHDGYVSGTLVKYQRSIISAAATHQHLAMGFEIGMRFHSAPVVRLADAKRVHLGHVIEADGRWRLIAFAGAGDLAEPSSAISSLAEFLDNSAESPVRKYTPAGQDVDAVIEVLAVFQQGYRELEFDSIPAFLWPSKGVYGMRDYEKVFCPDLENGENIFESRGINQDSGCMVLVRPDQHVAHILPLDGFTELCAFFDGFMVV